MRAKSLGVFDSRLTFGLVCILALLLVSSAVSFMNVRAILSVGDAARRSEAVLAATERLASGLVETDRASLRARAAGLPTAAADYEGRRQELFAALNSLSTLVSDRPEQRRPVADLQTLIGEQFSGSVKSSALAHRSGRDGATGRSLATPDRPRMDSIKAKLDEIQSAERALLTHRERDLKQCVFRASVGFAVSTIVAIALAVGYYVAVSRGVRADRQSVHFEARRANELEERVRERTAELEEAVSDMQSLSYSVSHDLRSPLRHVSSFAAILSEDLGPIATDTDRRHFSMVLAGCAKMSDVIDGLLVLSRAARTDLTPAEIDLSALAAEVFEDARGAPNSKSPTISIQPDMVAVGDRSLARILMTNLIANAIKFSGTAESPHIEVGSRRLDDQQVFFVGDNGVGFDPLFKAQLFQPFKRLHKADEFSGTGVGLAICHRIVKRHGGRIWAEGSVGNGATIFFALSPNGHADRTGQESGAEHTPV